MVKKAISLLIVFSSCGYFSFAWGADRGEIHSGETKIGLEIVGPSYMDTWTFYGDAGDRVLISVQATSGSLWPRINLYPPDSGPEEASNIEYLDHQLEQSGLYTIVVEDWVLSNEGTYDISLTKIPSTLRTGLYNPYPSNGSTITDLNGSFSWDPVSGATGYDLYFGENVIEPLEKIGDNLSSPSMPFPEMETGKIYYWHVVAHTPSGDIEGPYWWFQVSGAANQPPVIDSFNAEPTSGHAPLEVTFTCSAHDPDGYITEYRWDFDGDGNIDETNVANTTTYTYDDAGTYYAEVTVVDDEGGETTSDPITIEVNATWKTAYDILFDNPSDLELFRQYRDGILSKVTKGRMFKALLYETSEKALEVLLNNPHLMLQAKYLVDVNKDAVSEVLNGNEGVIYNTDEIISFLDAYADKSPPALKILANMVKSEMLRKQSQGNLFLGFELK